MEFLLTIQEKGYDEVHQAIIAAKNVYGDDMGAFLCWLGIRLIEMARVLKPTGSIYLHIDHTAHAYVKILMDAVFGKRNFQNEIVWCYRGGGVPSGAFARKHDTILFYSKSGEHVFNRQYVPYSTASQDLVGSKGGVSIDGKPRDLDRGAAMPDWWADINSLQTWSPERTGYPTQKPLALYERIIEASTRPAEYDKDGNLVREADLVLDPFCGCATTPIAAERKGRRWVGIDIWEGAVEVVRKRINDNRQLLVDIPPPVELHTTPPIRTDGQEQADLRLRTPSRGAKHPRPRTQHPKLLADVGVLPRLRGDYTDAPDVLEVDHMNPKSSGGLDAYDNLTLLCPPCNRIKSDLYTLGGLQVLNRTSSDGKRPRLTPERERNIIHGKPRQRACRR